MKGTPVDEVQLSNTSDGSRTYSLSFGSAGSLRSSHTSVSLLSLLSWGSNKTDESGVSLLSLCSRVSTQTGQTRRSLQEERKRRA